MVQGPDMKGTVPENLTQELVSDSNSMYSVGRRDRFSRSLRMRGDLLLHPKITIVLRLFVFRTTSTCTIVLVVDIFTSHEVLLRRRSG